MIKTQQPLLKLEQLTSQSEISTSFHVSKLQPICFDISQKTKTILIGYKNQLLIEWNIHVATQIRRSSLPFVPAQIFYSDDGMYSLIRPQNKHKELYLYLLKSMQYITISALENSLYGKILSFNIKIPQAVVMGLSDLTVINFDQKQQASFYMKCVNATQYNKFIATIDCNENICKVDIKNLYNIKNSLKKLLMTSKIGMTSISLNKYFLIVSNSCINRIWNVQTQKMLRKRQYPNYEISEICLQKNVLFFLLTRIGIVAWNISNGKHKIVVKDEKQSISGFKVISQIDLVYQQGNTIHSLRCN